MIGSITEFEIEEHVASTNRFFQLTGLTLDDLNPYARPLARVVNACLTVDVALGQRGSGTMLCIWA
jgi:hypothetical protein